MCKEVQVCAAVTSSLVPSIVSLLTVSGKFHDWHNSAHDSQHPVTGWWYQHKLLGPCCDGWCCTRNSWMPVKQFCGQLGMLTGFPLMPKGVVFSEPVLLRLNCLVSAQGIGCALVCVA